MVTILTVSATFNGKQVHYQQVAQAMVQQQEVSDPSSGRFEWQRQRCALAMRWSMASRTPVVIKPEGHLIIVRGLTSQHRVEIALVSRRHRVEERCVCAMASQVLKPH